MVGSFIQKSRGGLALVVVLCIIVLISGAVLAFFAQATANRGIESSRSHLVEAAQLSKSAGDYVMGTLLSGVADSTRSIRHGLDGTPGSSTPPFVYEPSTSAAMKPARALAAGLSQADTNFHNLLRQSVANADANASTHSTSEASANGRALSLSDWNASRLVVGGFTNVNQLPNWIYVNSDKSLSGTPSDDAIGRFAYNLYQIGGLLDVNVAGYPSGLSPEELAKIKGTPAGADLSTLPGIESSQEADKFVAWRNASATSSSYASHVSEAASEGYLRLLPGDRRLTTRQDLIKLAALGTYGLRTESLPYLRTFSLEVAAPSWGPSADALTLDPTANQMHDGSFLTGYTPTAYRTNRNSDSVTISGTNFNVYNRFLPNMRFRDDASVLEYDDLGREISVNVKAGDPLIGERFPLERLSWLGEDGPRKPVGSTASDEEFARAIKACFGLKWDDAHKRWLYVSASTADEVQYRLLSLSEVAKGVVLKGNVQPEGYTIPRRPNFFELLKAAILEDAGGPWVAWPPTVKIEGHQDLTILQIGANIVDQADGNDVPTAFVMSYWDPSQGQFFQDTRFGVENLPLVNGLILAAHRMPTNTPPYDTLHAWMEFQMWNPHANAFETGPPPRFRLRVVSGGGAAQFGYRYGQTRNADGSWPTGGTPIGGGWVTTAPSFGVGHSITVTSPNALSSPRILDSIRKFGGSAMGSAPMNVYEPGDTYSTSIVGLYLGEYGAANYDYVYYTEDGVEKRVMPFFPGNIAFSVSTEIALEFEFPGVGWRQASLIRFSADNGNNFNPMESDNFKNGNQRHAGFLWVDPRTNRIGAGVMYKGLGTVGNPHETKFWDRMIGSSLSDVTDWLPAGHGLNSGDWFPDSSRPTNRFPEYLFMPRTSWARYHSFRMADNSGGGTSASDPFYRDVDGVRRRGDAVWGVVSPLVPGYKEHRPRVLNRPFTSVGDLGYAFREMTFRSLDFRSARSGDAGLLDVFSVGGSYDGLRGGSIDLNQASPLVLASYLVGSGTDESQLDQGLSQAEANTVAQAVADSIGKTPLLSKADLALRLEDASFNLLGEIKPAREVVVRALNDVGQVRTQNYLVDIVAQTGRFVRGGTAASNFSISGEDHVWVSVALDRFDGSIVASEVENVIK